MIDAEDAHVRAAPRAALLDGFGCNVEHAHKADGAAGNAACGADGRALLAQARKRKSGAAAGLMDQRGVLDRLEDGLHAVLHGQHEAGRELAERAAGVHQRRRIWQKAQRGHQLKKLVRRRLDVC
ncbi:hypothetical protein SDC9_176943 [bioreactor metagenome]|uniref:Uncharacterized protein n=1 Tax=bioreactor metagenome TaxID=1076179 RepID=A0A645GT76_9ZZZZ